MTTAGKNEHRLIICYARPAFKFDRKRYREDAESLGIIEKEPEQEAEVNSKGV